MGDKTTSVSSNGYLGNLSSQMTQPGTISEKLRNASLDPEGTQKLIQAMQPIALGKEADLRTNPYYQSMLDAAYKQHQSGLGEGMNNLRSQFSKSGHNLDSAVQQGQQDLIRRSQIDYDAMIAKALQEQYNAEKTRQLQAASGLMTTYMTPTDLAAKEASMNRTQTTSSGWK